jgi:hypothetical protein
MQVYSCQYMYSLILMLPIPSLHYMVILSQSKMSPPYNAAVMWGPLYANRRIFNARILPGRMSGDGFEAR